WYADAVCILGAAGAGRGRAGVVEWRKRRRTVVASVERMTKGEAMLAVCRAYGMEYAFSSPGSEWPPLWDALARTEAEGTSPRFINSRHESVALGVATGYHRQTGRLPLVLLHTGAGTAHTAM